MLALPHDLLRAATGNPIIVDTVDGSPVLLRLPTVDEFLAAVERGHRWHEANGLEHPPIPSRECVAELVAPLAGAS